MQQHGPFNFANGQGSSNGAVGALRRPTLQPQGLLGTGGMGRNMRAPGKSGLTFDHILSRLQGELQKSRETGAELHSLSSGLAEIQDTLGGNLVRMFSFILDQLLTVGTLRSRQISSPIPRRCRL